MNTIMKACVAIFISALFSFVVIAEEKRPIFDAHIHYSHDVWNAINPMDAIQRLKAVGVIRALVSSTSDEGTQRLYKANPEFVIPVLRPYRKRGTLDSWMYDESVIPYLKDRLSRYKYAAIGEFHLRGPDANLPVVKQVVQLAKQHDLILHVHSDALAVEQIFKQDKNARILWAHAGFEFDFKVKEMMDKHNNLWADLSFRRDAFGNGQFVGRWRELLITHSDRFMLGIDTYTPQRWLKIKQVMQWQQELLAGLPENAARKIAYENGMNLFNKWNSSHE